jgi:hypothetical protein
MEQLKKHLATPRNPVRLSLGPVRGWRRQKLEVQKS